MDLKKKASKSIAIALVGVSMITPILNTVYADDYSNQEQQVSMEPSNDKDLPRFNSIEEALALGENMPNEFILNNRNRIGDTYTQISVVGSPQLVRRNKNIGWHPDWKYGERNVSFFYIGNATKSASFSLGAGYGAVSVSIGSRSAPSSGRAIKANPNRRQAPMVKGDHYRTKMKYVEKKKTTGHVIRTTYGYVNSVRNIWYESQDR